MREIPDLLFDGNAVYAALGDSARRRTGPENVSDVLDAVVSLLRGSRDWSGPVGLVAETLEGYAADADAEGLSHASMSADHLRSLAGALRGGRRRSECAGCAAFWPVGSPGFTVRGYVCRVDPRIWHELPGDLHAQIIEEKQCAVAAAQPETGRVREAVAPFLRALEEQEMAAAWELEDEGVVYSLSDHATLTGGPFGCRLTVAHARALRAAFKPESANG